VVAQHGRRIEVRAPTRAGDWTRIARRVRSESGCAIPARSWRSSHTLDRITPLHNTSGGTCAEPRDARRLLRSTSVGARSLSGPRSERLRRLLELPLFAREVQVLVEGRAAYAKRPRDLRRCGLALRLVVYASVWCLLVLRACGRAGAFRALVVRERPPRLGTGSCTSSSSVYVVLPITAVTFSSPPRA
jgi:hypothetical protein